MHPLLTAHKGMQSAITKNADSVTAGRRNVRSVWVVREFHPRIKLLLLVIRIRHVAVSIGIAFIEGANMQVPGRFGVGESKLV